MIAIGLVLAAVLAENPESPSSVARYAWQQSGDSLALIDNGQIVWRFNYKKTDGKACFHPLSVGGSEALTDFRPADHPWHRGVWFSWKSINDLLYWEEDRKTGKSPGVTEMVSCKAEARRDFSAEFCLSLSYHPPGKPPVLTEQRWIEVSPPGEKCGYFIDWQSRFTATSADAVLGRTPIVGEPRGVAWGGYAGFSLRLSPELRSWEFADGEGRVRDVWKTAPWMSFSGEVASADKTRSHKLKAAIVVLDHPSNLRHPTPWYLIQKMPYFSPAILYKNPYTLPMGKSVVLKYRVMLNNGAVDRDSMEKEWERFAQTSVRAAE